MQALKAQEEPSDPRKASPQAFQLTNPKRNRNRSRYE
jgi:hypothetical protein